MLKTSCHILSVGLIAFVPAQYSNAAVEDYVQQPDFTVDLTNINKAQTLFPMSMRIDANNDGYTWYPSAAGYYYDYNQDDATIGGDDWLISNKISITPGHKYQINISAYCTQARYPECIEVLVATQETTSPTQFDLTVIEPTEINKANSLTPAILSGTFTSTTASKIQIGIHEISEPDRASLYLTSLSVIDLGEDTDIPATQSVACQIDVESEDDGSLIAGYEYPASITVLNSADTDIDHLILEVFSGNHDAMTFSIETLKAKSSHIITTTCHPTLFDTESYTIKASVTKPDSDNPAIAEKQLPISRPTHPAPSNIRATNLQQYLVLINWDAPDLTETQFEVPAIQASQWRTNDRGALVNYNIYRDGTLVASVDPTQQAYYDNNNVSDISTYHVNAQYENGHSDLSEPVSISIITSANDIQISSPIIFSVNGRDITINAGITVRDLYGHTIFNGINSQTPVTLNLTPGLYLLSDENTTKKIIIK